MTTATAFPVWPPVKVRTPESLVLYADLTQPIGAVAARKARAEARRTYRSTAHCLSCGCFIRRPSAECGQCGNVPGTHNMTAREVFEYDRAYGWDDVP